MNKKDLLDLGIEDDDIAQKVIVLHGKDIEKLRSDLEVSGSKQTALKSQLEEANKTIQGFKELDIDSIKATADEWKVKAEQIQEEAEATVQKLKFDHALDAALLAAKAKNSKAVKALLNMEDLKLSNDGEETIIGLEGQLKKIAEKEEYLFDSGKTTPTIVLKGENKSVTVDTMLEAARVGAGLTETN